MPFPDTPSERYYRDPMFHQLVDTMEAAIRRCDYSPSEMREAATLACIHYEMTHMRSTTWYVKNDGTVDIKNA